MTTKPKPVRRAIYTRVSTEHGLDQEFNSLDAQHEAAEAYVRSQAHDGWSLIRTRYDDGGYSGGSTERPALQRLLADNRRLRWRLGCVAAERRAIADGSGCPRSKLAQRQSTLSPHGRPAASATST